MKCEAYTAMGNCCERDAREWYLVTLEGAPAAFYVCHEHAQLQQIPFIMRIHEAGVHISDKELVYRRELADKILRGEDPPADSLALEVLEASMKEVITPKETSVKSEPAATAPTETHVRAQPMEVPVKHSTGWFAVLCGCGPAF